MRWIAAGLTDTGRGRPQNEDAVLLAPDLGLYAVADGLGGHAAGEIASRLAVQVLEWEFARNVAAGARGETLRAPLIDAALAANRAILQQARAEPDKTGMATTLTALIRERDGLGWSAAHIGDSRLYRIRRGRIQQLSTDHTWPPPQTLHAARPRPSGGALSRALGIQPDPQIDSLQDEMLADDILLLCTDGLTAVLDEDRIRWLLYPDHPPATLVTRLVRAANMAGGPDNISVILIRPESALTARDEDAEKRSA